MFHKAFMKEALLQQLPAHEWMRWLRSIRRKPGALAEQDVTVVKVWLTKTLLPEQVKQVLDGWTGRMEVGPVGDSDVLVVYLLKHTGERQAVSTSIANLQTQLQKSAFRNAIADQTQQFRQQWRQDPQQEKVCDHCKCSLETGDVESHVDHVHVPFCELLRQFKEGECLTGDALVHREKITNRGERWMLQQADLRQRWQEFHAQRAQLRMLCKSCNIGVCNVAKKQVGSVPRTHKRKRKGEEHYAAPLFLNF